MVFDGAVNYFAVLVAAIVSFIIGWLWYGPLFGKVWAKEMGFNMEKMKKDSAKKKGMGKLMVLSFIGTLIMVCVLAHFALNLANTYSDVFQLAFWIWLGFFVATTCLNDVLWNGKSWTLFLINAAYWLVNILVASSILFAWR